MRKRGGVGDRIGWFRSWSASADQSGSVCRSGERARLGSPDLTATGAELRPLVPLQEQVAELERNWDPSQVTGPKVAASLQISHSYARRLIRENRMSEAPPLRGSGGPLTEADHASGGSTKTSAPDVLRL